MLKKILKNIPFIGGTTLYYPGCLTRFVAPELMENYEKFLEKIGIDYITIPEFNCCGAPAFHAGYDSDFYELSQKNKDIFKEHKVKQIITNCPSCAQIFSQLYGLKAIHITQLITKHLSAFEPVTKDEPICYHDPCHLARKGSIIKEPRKILSHLGYEIVEMANNGADTLCCGGGGGLKSNDPKLSDKIAKIRLKQCKTAKLVTTCPMCYKNLKQNSKDIKVFELSEVLLGD